MPKAEARAAEVFAALGDPTRLALVARLGGAEALSISALAGQGAITRQAITKHLRVLEQAGLVQSRRVGRESRFALQAAGFAEAEAFLRAVTTAWDDALARLQAHLAQGPAE